MLQETMQQQNVSTLDIVSIIKACKEVTSSVQASVDTLVHLASDRPLPPVHKATGSLGPTTSSMDASHSATVLALQVGLLSCENPCPQQVQCAICYWRAAAMSWHTAAASVLASYGDADDASSSLAASSGMSAASAGAGAHHWQLRRTM